MNAPAIGKRISNLDVKTGQGNNRLWWSANPMTYDHRRENGAQPLSIEWFERMDSTFIHIARLFATDTEPFDRLIPYSRLTGKRVLEIGCGMGLHTELMARSGADVTSVDLTSAAVEATVTRLQLKGLRAKVCQQDAESLPFPDKCFDFVWSWGVIHHSSRTARIVREIARVLKPDGECRIMVYNRAGMPAWIAFVRDFVLKGKWINHSFDEVLWASSDGFSARFYTPDQFEDLFRAFFREVNSSIVGVEQDAVPLPRKLRSVALKVVPDSYLRKAQGRRGAFIFLCASSPD